MGGGDGPCNGCVVSGVMEGGGSSERVPSMTSARLYANEMGLHQPAPYLDILTINTSQFVAPLQGDNREPHSILLIEPVSVAKLGHTGLSSSLLPSSEPLYYPNGARRIALRENITQSIRELYSTAASKTDGLHKDEWVTSTRVDDLYRIDGTEYEEKVIRDVEKKLSPHRRPFIGPVPRPEKKKKENTRSMPLKHVAKSLDGTTIYISEEERQKKGRTLSLLKSLRHTNQLLDRMGKIK